MTLSATKAKEIGLLFTPENRDLVRRGLKTETRRAINIPASPNGLGRVIDGIQVGSVTNIIPFLLGSPGLWDVQFWLDNPAIVKSPYGNPQSEPVRYYVKEPVQIVSINDGVEGSPLLWVELIYLDDGKDSTVQACEISWEDHMRLMARKDWRKPSTSLFMLKSFARTWLTGKRVWPEQLGKMSEWSLLAEGIEREPSDNGFPPNVWRDYLNGGYDLSMMQSYASLWDSINGKGSWHPDKWVWAVQWEGEAASEVAA
jgi:hypothetical protein